MAIKSFTDTYKIKGSDIDRFCRIMSDTKKIKIQITNDHHDLKDVEEFKMNWFINLDSVRMKLILNLLEIKKVSLERPMHLEKRLIHS